MSVTDHAPLRRDLRDARPRERGFLWYLGTALSAALLVLVMAVAVLTVALPALTGSRALTVLTGSMEPTLPPGTLIVVKPLAPENVRVGDILTYQIESGRPEVVTHRVIERALQTDGAITFTTQGDANDTPDPEPVREVQVVGTLWYSLPLLGWVNTAVNGELRAFIIPGVVAVLFLYAITQIVGGVVAARRRRRS